MSENQNIVEFIPRGEMEDELKKMAARKGDITQKSFSRQAVVSAFTDAFELIGGIPRLALWADEHPTEFYRIYSKLLPAQSDKTLSGEVVQKIVHVLPRSPLDE